MKSMFTMVLIFVGGQIVILGIGIAEGFLVHWAIPAIGLDGAILAAVLTTMAMIYVFSQVAKSVVRTHPERADASDDDEEEHDDEDDEGDEDDDEVISEEFERHARELNRLLRPPPPPMQHHRRSRRRKK
jgi:hypothetical protein